MLEQYTNDLKHLGFIVFFVQKLHDRTAFLKKTSLSEWDKLKWKPVMSSEFMSSEESDTEDSENLLKRSIPWRSNKVNNFFSELDKLQEKHPPDQFLFLLVGKKVLLGQSMKLTYKH